MSMKRNAVKIGAPPGIPFLEFVLVQPLFILHKPVVVRVSSRFVG
jgi:hypothetical protein